MLIEIFSGILFWALLAVAGVALLSAVEFKRPGMATLVLVVTVLSLQLFTALNPLGWVTAHPLEAIQYIVGYFVLGALYVVARWTYYVKTHREQIQQGFDEYKRLARNSTATTVDQVKREFKSSEYNPVRLRDHKGLIMLWLNFWPASFAWMAVHVPIKHGWKFIYSNIAGLLARIANSEIDKALR